MSLEGRYSASMNTGSSMPWPTSNQHKVVNLRSQGFGLRVRDVETVFLREEAFYCPDYKPSHLNPELVGP